MGFKALTVNTPVEEPAHILAEDDATLYGAVIGGDCVLPVGSQFSAKVTSNNNVRLSDGMVLVGGHVGRIVKGDYEDMVIENGVSGQNRNDLIVARFISGGTSGADDYRLVVIKGTPGATANDPAAVKGDLYAGDKQRDYPLWRVRLTGLSIAGVDKLFTTGRMMPDKLDKTGDASKVTNIFTQAGSRNNLESGEKLSVSLGKIMKWFTDIHNALFGNTIKTSDGKAEMRSDGEGGNFTIISPQGIKWEIDTYNGQLRIICLNKNKSFSIDQTGNGYIYDILLSKSSRWASDWIVHLENLYNQLHGDLSNLVNEHNKYATSALKWYSANEVGITANDDIAGIANKAQKNSVVELFINGDTVYGQEIRKELSYLHPDFYGFLTVRWSYDTKNCFFEACEYRTGEIFTKVYTKINGENWGDWRRLG